MKVTGDAADGFFYDLLRDHLPAGKVEAILREAEAHSHEELEFTNPHVAQYAKEVRLRLDRAAKRSHKAPVRSLDSLRDNHTQIHYFGLGFVQVKMKDGTRYHFYHPSLESFVENPHNHRYHFTSRVLRGTLTQRIWESHEGPTCPSTAIPAVQRFVSCAPGLLAPETRTPVHADLVASVSVHAGSSYYISSDTFHQVFRSGEGPCITFLKLGPKVKDLSTILEINGQEEPCPFSQNKPISELWDIVQACIL